MTGHHPELIAVVFIGLLWLHSPATKASVEDFSRNPALEMVTISPKGTYLAVIHRDNESDKLSILKLPSLKVVYSSSFEAYQSPWRPVWATDERLLLHTAVHLPARDYYVSTGDILAIGVNDADPELLYNDRFGQTSSGPGGYARAGARVIDTVPENRRHVIIQTRPYGSQPERAEARLLNIHNGRTRPLAHSPINNGQFVTDLNHQISLVTGVNGAGDHEVYLREGGSDDRFELAITTPSKGGSLVPIIGADEEGYFLFADSVSHPTKGLIYWNPQTNERRELFRHPQVDYSDVFLTPDRQIWAVRFVDHFPDYFYPDPAHPLATLHRRLRASFPGSDVQIISSSDDGKIAVAALSGPQEPGAILLLDTQREAVLHRMDSRPWLTGRKLATVEPIEVIARDGMKIRGYFTRLGNSARSEPLVVLVRGNPSLDSYSWEFDAEAQMLAERGYVVLQVNFRGSAGRGREFLSAGYGKWGEETQDDITDSVHFLIDEGIADPDRICIYGASLGGYSALVGAYRDPNLYRCAIGYAGVYDLPLLFRTGGLTEFGKKNLEYAIGGHIKTSRPRSPVQNADRISARVMLVHGKEDWVAPYGQALRMRQALIDAGNPPEWMAKNNEGHGFDDEDNRLAMYTALLEFLDENLMPGTRD